VARLKKSSASRKFSEITVTKYRVLAVYAILALISIDSAHSQELVLDGHYNCARATNGRTYCKKRGTRNYTPVSEEFFSRYEKMRTGRPAKPAITQQVVNTTNVSIVVQNLTNDATDLQGQIQVLSAVANPAEQREI
jgi:hypothetical protein